MNNLPQIINDFEPLKNAIDKSVKEKMFVRQGFKKDVYNLSDTEQIYFISNMLANQNTCLCVKINNIIEWTPIKLYQSAYFIVYLYEKYWIIKRDAYSCSIILNIGLKDYISYVFKEGMNNNRQFPFQLNILPKMEEFNSVIHNLLKTDAVYIKKDKFNINNKLIVINHYLYKYNDNIYYIPILHSSSLTSIYKPLLYCKYEHIITLG